jgi:hypothetical protein
MKQPFGVKPARSCLQMNALHWRKPQDRKRRRFRIGSRQELPAHGRDEY